MMFWLRRKKEIEKRQNLEQLVSVEVQRHQKATKKTIIETKKATDNFNRVIAENGFTIKIHVAAGGKH